MFPPCHDFHLAILPLLACGLDLPSPLLSLWQLLIQMPPEREGEGQVKCHAWKVLDTKLGWWGCPMQPMPCIGFPFPLTIGATLAVVWVLSGALIPSPSSSDLFSSSGEREEKRSLLPAQIFLLMFITCTCSGERGMKCLSLVFPWWKREWAVHLSFHLWEDNANSVTLPQPQEAGLPPCA